jgi:hypothetical protein
MTISQLFLQSILTPSVLFFILGGVAGLIRSDLKIPESISRFLSLYLMIAIGFKGGVALADTPCIDGQILLTLFCGVGIGFLQPFIAFACLKATTPLDRATAAAVAAHYGSISVVTFVAAVSFLMESHVLYAGYMVAVLALMEAPAILSGLLIAQQGQGERHRTHHLREIFTSGPIVLLMGALIIGALTGQDGLKRMNGFLIEPFQGFLALFLLDMGLLVARHAPEMKAFRLSVFAFGLYMPLIGATLGLGLSTLLSLDVGTGMLFMVLCASASYIAVPAAMITALPEAKTAIYIPLTLGVTFPFNITLGIPFYFWLANQVLS